MNKRRVVLQGVVVALAGVLTALAPTRGVAATLTPARGCMSCYDGIGTQADRDELCSFIMSDGGSCVCTNGCSYWIGYRAC